MSDLRKWKSLVESMNLSEDPVQDADYTDHEVSMAKSQMLSSMKSINRIAKHLATKSESEGLEGWTASKLTMAEDYLQAVADYFDGQEINEGYKVMPPMDPKYVARKGLEGPFSTLSGKVVYYDPKAGKYYDPDTDMYMSYDEFRRYDDDYKGMKDERDEVKEGDDTVKVVFRKFDNGDVIALFPEEEQGRGLITSYMEIGQHSDASKSLITDLEPASKEEYAELAAELKRIGYDIVIAESVNEAKLSPEQREELDDLIDMVKWGTSPSTYDDDARDAAMQALKTIRSKFGDNVADQVGDGIHDFHFPKHGMAPGTYGTDRLASKKPTAIKKDGKIDSRSARSTKRDIKSNLRSMGKKDPKRLGEADETKYGIIRYPDTAISYIKNDGNGWEHIFDKSYGFEGPVDKEDLQYAKKIEKEKIPSRMFESSEMMTEAQFDEAAGEKDACYHKVKSRYKVWPSAYASGALVKCRKVGAKNWGNSKKD
jgi:hypothetical protein